MNFFNKKSINPYTMVNLQQSLSNFIFISMISLAFGTRQWISDHFLQTIHQTLNHIYEHTLRNRQLGRLAWNGLDSLMSFDSFSQKVQFLQNGINGSVQLCANELGIYRTWTWEERYHVDMWEAGVGIGSPGTATVGPSSHTRLFNTLLNVPKIP